MTAAVRVLTIFGENAFELVVERFYAPVPHER
jgi:hypothetical protein